MIECTVREAYQHDSCEQNADLKQQAEMQS
jgi:hypothetical protein